MMMLVELLMTGAAILLPLVAILVILAGKRKAGVVSLLFAILAVFLLGFGMGFHSQAREARRRFHSKIAQPLRLIVQHMQGLSAQGKTNELDEALSSLEAHDLRLFLDARQPRPELIEVFKNLTEGQGTSDANNTSDGIRQPADGSPKPSR